MKNLLALVAIFSAFALAQSPRRIERSMTIIERQTETAAPYPLAPANLGEGAYTITNVHSGYALGVQAWGLGRRLLAQFEVGGETWEFVPAAGRYRIRGAGGELSESEGKTGVRVERPGAGSLWEVSRIEGGETFEIRGPSGRVLSNMLFRLLDGNWVIMDGRTGGANQEWSIRPRSTILAGAPRPQAHVRALGGRRLAVTTAAVRSAPAAAWGQDPYGFVYSFRMSAPALSQLLVEYLDGREAVSVQAPEGWGFLESGWYAKPAGAPVSLDNGVFVMRSSWAPGPVLVTAVGDAEIFEYSEDSTTPDQFRAAAEAQTNRGSYHWRIGPAIPPGADRAKLRELAERWRKNGLAFVGPMLDAEDLAAGVEALQPGSAFERELVRVLRAAIEGAK